MIEVKGDILTAGKSRKNIAAPTRSVRQHGQCPNYVSEGAPLYSTYASRRSHFTDAGYGKDLDNAGLPTEELFSDKKSRTESNSAGLLLREQRETRRMRLAPLLPV